MTDAGGHLVSLAREDGASLLRPSIAIGKAHTALAMGMSSRQVGEVAAARPSFVAALAPIAPLGIIPAAGGVLITDNARVIGAVAVSGDTPDNDEACALHGIAAFFMSTIVNQDRTQGFERMAALASPRTRYRRWQDSSIERLTPKSKRRLPR